MRLLFYPITQLTTNERLLSAKLAQHLLPHITAPSIVEIIKRYEHVAEVQFPGLPDTDIVSVDFLHKLDSPEARVLTKTG